MTNYNIFIRSNEHPRTINSYSASRCYYNRIQVQGREALEKKVAELLEAGEHISEICTDLGTRVNLPLHGLNARDLDAQIHVAESLPHKPTARTSDKTIERE